MSSQIKCINQWQSSEAAAANPIDSEISSYVEKVANRGCRLNCSIAARWPEWRIKTTDVPRCM